MPGKKKRKAEKEPDVAAEHKKNVLLPTVLTTGDSKPKTESEPAQKKKAERKAAATAAAAITMVLAKEAGGVCRGSRAREAEVVSKTYRIPSENQENCTSHVWNSALVNMGFRNVRYGIQSCGV